MSGRELFAVGEFDTLINNNDLRALLSAANSWRDELHEWIIPASKGVSDPESAEMQLEEADNLDRILSVAQKAGGLDI
jgi:hypothetical protein